MNAFIKLLLPVVWLFTAAVHLTNAQDPLYQAVISADLEKAEQLLTSGAELNWQAENGYTPLMLACTYSSTPEFALLAEKLVAKGADLDLTAQDGTTALMEAAGNSRQVFDLLLENGADLQARREDGTGVLRSAVLGVLHESVPADFIDYLLAKGLDVNESATSGGAVGWTALHFAAANNQQELAGILIRNKADVNAVASGDFTPLSLAESNGYDEMVEILKSAGAK
jgi:ankyrin repeat protein